MQRPTSGKPFSFDSKLLQTACIALLSAQVPLLVATLPLGLHGPAAIAQAQSAEMIGTIAKSITVRIEGATQGSGVLVKRDGNRYTVLTAWHVVSEQRPGEELDIYTPDGQRHSVEQGSIKQLAQLDMAVLTFTSAENPTELTGVGIRFFLDKDSKDIVVASPIKGSPASRAGVQPKDVITSIDGKSTQGVTQEDVGKLMRGKEGSKVTLSLRRKGQVLEVPLVRARIETHTSYEVARVGNAKSASSGQQIIVAGFPNDSNEKLEVYLGSLIANATTETEQGYQLIYDTATRSGMSGGAILDKNGMLIGIHGRGEVEFTRLKSLASGELDNAGSEFAGDPFKTGLNMGIPIYHYDLYTKGLPITTSSDQAKTTDDFIALLIKSSNNQDIIKLADYILATQQSKLTTELKFITHISRAYAKAASGDQIGAIYDFDQAISIDPNHASALANRGLSKHRLGDMEGAISDLNRAITIDPEKAPHYFNRGVIKANMGDKKGAIADYSKSIAKGLPAYGAHVASGRVKYALGDLTGAIADFNQAISINPKNGELHFSRALAKQKLGDNKGAIEDYSQAIGINPKDYKAYFNRAKVKANLGDTQGVCSDIKKAAYFGSDRANEVLLSDDFSWCRDTK